MKKIIIIIAIAVLAAAAIFFYWYSVSKASVGSLNIYNGQVDIVRNSKSQDGKTGLGLKPDDVLKVHSNSRVSIILKDGSVIRLEAGTEVSLAKLVYSGDKIKDAEFDVKSGRLWSHDQPLAPAGNYQVETPTVVAAVRGTSFNVDYLNATSTVYVYTHSVKVNLKSRPDALKGVMAGYVFNISDANAQSDFDAGPILAGPGIVDDWVTFNEREDDILDGSAAASNSAVSQTPSSTPASLISTTTPASRTLTPPPPVKPAGSQPPPPLVQQKQALSLKLSSANTQVNVGQSTLLKVAAQYADGSSQDVVGQVSWQQSPEIGTIKGSFYTGVFAGTSQITASLGNVVSNQISLTVGSGQSQAAPSLSRIAVSCVKSQSNSFTANFLPTAQCSATGYYSDGGNKSISSQVAWTASGSAGGSIDASGHYVPKNEGSESITASLDQISGSASLTIP